MPGKVDPLRLGTHDGGVQLVATADSERATLATANKGPLHLTPKGAEHLATWLRAWARPRTKLKLWGHGDIARECKVSKPTVTNWLRHPTFPEPVAEPSCGKVWDAEQVRAWVKADRRGPGRPRNGQ